MRQIIPTMPFASCRTWALERVAEKPYKHPQKQGKRTAHAEDGKVWHVNDCLPLICVYLPADNVVPPSKTMLHPVA